MSKSLTEDLGWSYEIERMVKADIDEGQNAEDKQPINGEVK